MRQVYRSLLTVAVLATDAARAHAQTGAPAHQAAAVVATAIRAVEGGTGASQADTRRARVEDDVDPTAPARALGAVLFGAGGTWLPRGLRRLVVVPDGALHRAPLALLDPDRRGPLGERVALSIAPSATVATISIVHLATHAYMDDARPGASLVALAPGGGHDGFLRASELATLPLAADLVVLSGCGTTGDTVLGGERVQGFNDVAARGLVAYAHRSSPRRTPGSRVVAPSLDRGLRRGNGLGYRPTNRPIVDRRVVPPAIRERTHHSTVARRVVVAWRTAPSGPSASNS